MPPAKSSKVCKLVKSLYGLKQAPRQWFAKLSSALVSFGFKQSKDDYSLFTKSKGADYIAVLIYVDDMLLTSNSMGLIVELKEKMNTQFHKKDLGEVKYFLGLEVTRSSKGIFVSQRKYLLDLLTEFGVLQSKPLRLPLDPNIKLRVDQGTLLLDPSLYRRLVGKLIYLTVTRPDLAFTVQVISQFMSAPTDVHLEAAMHVLRYLKHQYWNYVVCIL